MSRDGLRATPSTIAALLTLYTKAAHLSCRGRGRRSHHASNTVLVLVLVLVLMLVLVLVLMVALALALSHRMTALRLCDI